MLFSEENRIELRKSIEEILKEVPKGKRLKLDKELLEHLLFENYIDADDEKKLVAKRPAWSGEFLRKLDLSEVDFEDVMWNLNDLEDEYDRKKIERYPNGAEFFVNYSNTNAKIDFRKSYETKRYGFPEITKVNFSGLDFSEYDINMFSVISDTNLSNTGMKISDLSDLTNKEFQWSIFDNLDFSNQTLDAFEIANENVGHFLSSSFKNTGLNIKVDKLKFDKEDYEGSTLSEFWDPLLKDGYLNGCRINGKLIQSYEDILEFLTYLDDKDKATLLASIDDQIKRLVK